MRYDGESGRRLAEQYETVAASDIHRWLVPHLPEAPAAILDVGAGSGRDAAWFTAMGHEVVAVEPSPTMRAEAERRHRDPRITWIDDRLPSLDAVFRRDLSFDVILLSAVWMHVAPEERGRAFRKLATLLRPNGLIAITLRDGPLEDSMHPISALELTSLAQVQGAYTVHEGEAPDGLRREDVRWRHVAFRLPDDGTGALPLLRHIIVNDAKASTYKLGLLRAIARLADGAQGLARHQDDQVIVPLGAVALNWIRLYKPLLEADLPQSPTNRGTAALGFAKAAWHDIAHLAAGDLRFGARFHGRAATALHGALRDAASTIARMPATFMTYPGRTDPVFPTALARAGRAPTALELSAGYLAGFGSLAVPIRLWRSLSRFDAWIEPALVAEWSGLMERYALGQGRPYDPATGFRAMGWHDPVRTTTFVRRIAMEMLETRTLHCVWSGKRLSASTLDVDHMFPWTVWPCDDLWNLLPTNAAVNRNLKRQKLPSAELINRRRDSLIEWWTAAYRHRDEATAMRFASEAQATLPLPASDDHGSPQLIAAIQSRRAAIRTDQQIAEWRY